MFGGWLIGAMDAKFIQARIHWSINWSSDGVVATYASNVWTDCVDIRSVMKRNVYI